MLLINIRKLGENGYMYFITMGNRSHSRMYVWVLQVLLVFLVWSFDIYEAKVAVIHVVFWFSPYHWHTKFELRILSLRPVSQCFHTHCANLVWRPTFVLVTKRYSKISKVNFLIKLLILHL